MREADGSTLIIGCGFIGSNVVLELVRRGERPRVLSRSRPVEELVVALGDPGRLLIGDAADPLVLAAALDGVERVVYAAGGLLPAASDDDPELDRRLTLRPIEALLAALRQRPSVSLTYLSSGGTVYGEPARIPVSEDDEPRPTSTYGRLHLECERMIGAARADYGLRARALRCATVYGEHQRPDRGQGAVVTFLHRIERGEEIHLYGGGSTIRDYVYVGDVAAVVAGTIAVDSGPAVLNVGSGEGTSLLDLLGLAEAEVGKEARIVRHEERGFDVHRIVLGTARLRELTGFEPTPLPAGIARTHAWLRETYPEGV